MPYLPKRRDFPRGKPLTLEQWLGVQDHEGKIEDSECLKLMIFQGVSDNSEALYCIENVFMELI